MIVINKEKQLNLVIEARGSAKSCIGDFPCWVGTGQGVIAYTVDSSKLSADGAIRIAPTFSDWPNVALPGSSFNVAGTDVNVLQCTDTGCYVEIKS